MRTVVLVPWRAGNPIREANWAATRPELEALGHPLYLGDRPGPWSRAGAINAAAADAWPWDVAIIADADTIPDPVAIAEAVRVALRTGGGVRPHDHLWNLNKLGTRELLRLGREDFSGAFRPAPHALGCWPGGGLLVVERSAWERVGGHDERFVGWGHEDSALNIRLLVYADWNRIPGVAFHLWHPRDATDTPARRENRRRMQALHAFHSPVIERVSLERGWDVGSVL